MVPCQLTVGTRRLPHPAPPVSRRRGSSPAGRQPWGEESLRLCVSRAPAGSPSKREGSSLDRIRCTRQRRGGDPQRRTRRTLQPRTRGHPLRGRRSPPAPRTSRRRGCHAGHLSIEGGAPDSAGASAPRLHRRRPALRRGRCRGVRPSTPHGASAQARPEACSTPGQSSAMTTPRMPVGGRKAAGLYAPIQRKNEACRAISGCSAEGGPSSPDA